MKIAYQQMRFGAAKRKTIETANAILEEYEAQGFDLTLRQLYYQFVARGLIPNSQREYKNLGSTINDGRLAGEIDWDRIVDRTRNVRGNPHWGSPADIVRACAAQFHIDKWTDQDYRIEVWIEKDALIGVIERVCLALDLSYFSCRGYVSQSEMHETAKDRLIPFERAGQKTVILHLGDHDPSGVDMSRDIQERLNLFGSSATVHRLALTMAQVQQYNPPPNPAKITDSRAQGYIRNFGDESWELDALEPTVMAKLITDAVIKLRDPRRWKAKVELEQGMTASLKRTSDHWDDVQSFLSDSDGDSQ